MRLIHFSDVHVQVDYPSLPWRPLGWRRWAALVEHIGFRRGQRYLQAEANLATLASEAERVGAEHAVLSGDLTAMAMDEEFSRARAALGRLADDPRRLSVIPGNHDVYARDAWNEGRFQRHFGHLLVSDLPEYQREGPYPFVRLLGQEAAVVGLTSARVPLFPGIALGWVGHSQLDGLAALIRDPRLAERMVFVAVHHAPLTPRGRQDSRTHRLHDGQALLELLRGERYAVLFGHIHHRYSHPSDGVRPHLFCAGSSTMRGREGYWLYDVQGGRLASARMLRYGEAAPPA